MTEVEKILSSAEGANELLTKVKTLVNNSRQVMAKYYATWDENQRVYEARLPVTVADAKAKRDGKTGKMAVPNTYAQVMTFTSFCFLLFKQNEKFFQLVGTGQEDESYKREDIETILEHENNRMNWDAIVFQSLLDVARFGIGVIETEWQVKTQKVETVVSNGPANYEGIQVERVETPTWVDIVQYEGNVARSVSPYRFFPDTRLPLSEMQNGEFCAVEQDYTKEQLISMEKSGFVFGLEHVTRPTTNHFGIQEDRSFRGTYSISGIKDNWPITVTKIQLRCVPSEVLVSASQQLGPETHEMLYEVWLANCNRVIRAVPVKNWHGQFRWNIGQFTPDMADTMSMSLADLINRLQEIISWFVNARIESVTQVVGNRLIVDPNLVDMTTVKGRGDIHLKKGATVPLERVVGQLRVQDVTSGHLSDVQVLTELIQLVTGVNNNAMGQYNSGRRSAMETKIVTGAAAGRMKMHANLLWSSLYSPHCMQRISNVRQALSYESFKRIVGAGRTNEQTGLTADVDLQNRYADFQGTVEEVVGGTDYTVFDASLASDRGFIASSLQEMFTMLVQNPQAAVDFDISPKAILEDLLRLRGIKAGTYSHQARVAKLLDKPIATPQIESQV